MDTFTCFRRLIPILQCLHSDYTLDSACSEQIHSRLGQVVAAVVVFFYFRHLTAAFSINASPNLNPKQLLINSMF
jgi:hypothetical protein